MKTFLSTKSFEKKTIATMFVALVSFLLLLCGGLYGCSSSDSSSQSTDSTETVSEEATDEFIAHGLSYSKSETVKAVSDLNGTISGIAVTDTIANPDELATIEDKTELTSVKLDEDCEGVTASVDGENITWTTNGQDITYTGLTTKELPFDISYTYKLDGVEIDPSQLEGAEGKLTIEINYKNNTSACITSNGTSYNIKNPYIMASLIAFDSTHAKNIEVDNGTVLEMNGSIIAAGIGMPGLTETLGLSGTVDLPSSVTITADVKGFESPTITTMVTDKALSALDGKTSDAESSIAEAFDSLNTLQEGINNLATANSALSTGLGSITTGATSMSEQLPNAQSGLSQFATVANGINAQATNASNNTATALSNDQANLEAIEALLDGDNLTDEQRASLNEVKSNLEESIASENEALNTLGETEDAKPGTTISNSAALSTGLTTVSDNFEKVVTGAQGLSTALTQMSAVSTQLASGTATLSDGISTMLSSAQSTINGKLDLVEAISKYVSNQGAWCGSASGMDASTTFTVTAKA